MGDTGVAELLLDAFLQIPPLPEEKSFKQARRVEQVPVGEPEDPLPDTIAECHDRIPLPLLHELDLPLRPDRHRPPDPPLQQIFSIVKSIQLLRSPDFGIEPELIAVGDLQRFSLGMEVENL